MIEEWVGTLHDIHEQRESAETLLLRDRSLGAIAQGVVITDARQADNPITYVNTAFQNITGFSAQESLGKNCRFLQGLRSDPQVIERIRAALTRRQVARETLINYKKSGEPLHNELSVAPVFDNSGDLTHFVGIQSDVTASVSISEQLRQAQKMEAVVNLQAVSHTTSTIF